MNTWTPFDEPTTINRGDLPPPNGTPHRHQDTDLRPSFAIVFWVVVCLVFYVAVVAAVVGLWGRFST